MKKLFFLLFAISVSTFAQNNHSYPTSGFVKENNFGDWIKYTVTGGSGAWDTGHKVGVWYASSLGKWDETRNIDSWTWTSDDIPTIATVTSVRIRFRAKNWDYNQFQFTLNNINHVWGDSNFNYYNAFTATNQVDNISITESSDGYAYFDKTYPSGSDLCNAVNSAVQSGLYYFTLGIKIAGSYQPPSWWDIYAYNRNRDDYPAIDLQINYNTTPLNYQFSNVIESNTTYGTIKITNDKTNEENTYNSGTTVPLDPKYTYSAITNVLPFSANWNGSGYTEKDLYWNVNSSPNYLLTYNLQPDLDHTAPNLQVKFGRTSTVTIKNTFEESSIDGGKVNIKDPWYYYQDNNNLWHKSDVFQNYTSPLLIQNNSTSSYGGVFLNQPFTGNNPVYYTVKAESPQPVTINNKTHNFYFQNWEANPSGSASFQNANLAETPVMFNNTGATVKAVMKGTQLSNTAAAFSNSGQRKVITTQNGNMHMTYESMNFVWLEKSTDNGTTWQIPYFC